MRSAAAAPVASAVAESSARSDPASDLPGEEWAEPDPTAELDAARLSTDPSSADPSSADPAVARAECAAVPYELRKDELDVNNDGCRYNLGVTSACVENFWQRVQRTFAEKDVDALVALTDAEFRVNFTPRKRQRLRPSNPRRLAARLFTEEIRSRLARANLNGTMCNNQGTMIDNGLLWADVSPSDGQLRLKVLNQMN